jgi:hypothetical protein
VQSLLSMDEFKTPVDAFYDEYLNIIQYLIEKKEPSFTVIVQDNFKKNLVLSAASYFEHSMIMSLIQWFETCSTNNHLLVSFLKNKALNRQYHTLFDWDNTSSGANKFFSLFGEDFSKKMKTEIKSDSILKDGISSFLELGQIRNRLVHQNFSSFTLEKTTEEIYDLYVKARFFGERFGNYLQQNVTDQEISTSPEGAP